MAGPRTFSSAPVAAPLRQQQFSLLSKLQLPLLAAATLLLCAPSPSLGINVLPFLKPKGPPPPAPPPIPNPACPRCTFLSDRVLVTRSNNWGYPKPWPCRMSTLRPVGAPDNGTYNARCPLPPRLVASGRALSLPGGRACHLTCPTEPHCWGRQCFGNLYLAANRYDAYINTVMRCTANPIACVAKEPLIAAYLGISRRPDGKFMDPKTESSKPPFTKNNPLRPITPPPPPSGGSGGCQIVGGAIVCGV